MSEKPFKKISAFSFSKFYLFIYLFLKHNKYFISSLTKIFKCFWGKMNFKVCSVILYSNKAGKKVSESELQLTIIWLELSAAPPVIINMQRKENHLQPSYCGLNVAPQSAGTLSYHNGSYIFNPS